MRSISSHMEMHSQSEYNEDNKSVLSKLSRDENKDTIPHRIKFIKTLLNGTKLKPIIDFDNVSTEQFVNDLKDDDSGGSRDTRVTLNKEVHDITNVINTMGGTLQYFKSGTTGHTFKGEERDANGDILYEYAVKVVAYSIKDKYGSMYDTQRPENVELMMIKLLSMFIIKKKTPHIALPIGWFDTDIKNFTNLIEEGYVKKDNEKYNEFIKRYQNGEYYNDVSVLISEWADKGDLADFIRKNYKRFTPLHWKVLFFQLISTLAVIQSKYPNFRHNDLKANNILVTRISTNIQNYWYSVVGDLYNVPNIGYQIKLWDFDFACIPGIVDNKKVMISNKWSRGINVGPTQNRYYDIHYFFNTLINNFFSGLFRDHRVPKEVKDFVLSIVPPEFQTGDSVAEGGRILHNMEHTIPVDILRYNPYFNEFRVNLNNIHRAPKMKIKPNVEHKIHDFLKVSDEMPRQIKRHPYALSVVSPTNTPSATTAINNKIATVNDIESIMYGGKNTFKAVKSKEHRVKTFTKDDDDNEKSDKLKPKIKASSKTSSKTSGNVSYKAKSKSKAASKAKAKPKSRTKSKSKAKSKTDIMTKINKQKINTHSKVKSKSKPTSKGKPNNNINNVTVTMSKQRAKKNVDEIDIEKVLMGQK